MNTQNLEFLKKSLLNLGFGDKLNAELEKQIRAKAPEFNLAVTQDYNQRKVDYTLHFKAGSKDENYFFNKFDASINDGKQDERQTFYINKGSGITAKEAFNLMEGRSVNKQLFNAEGQKYNAWLQLDKDNLTDGGNKKIRHFNEAYGYQPEQVLAGKGIKEMDGGQAQDNLLRSLRKGNAQQITVDKDGNSQKYFITANPQFKTVDLYDHQMKRMKREELLSPQAKQSTAAKQGARQDQKEETKKKSSRSHKISA